MEGTMFIQTEATPNPATMKFLPGRSVLEHGTLDLRDAAQAEQSPLAERLFGIPGVSGVFFGSDFITVTKSVGEWQQLKPMILGAIMEHFMSGAPLITPGSAEVKDGEEFFDEADAATVLFSYSTSEGEPQACSVGFACGHERIEQRPPDRGRYTGTIVRDCDVDPFIEFRNLDLYLRHVS